MKTYQQDEDNLSLSSTSFDDEDEVESVGNKVKNFAFAIIGIVGILMLVVANSIDFTSSNKTTASRLSLAQSGEISYTSLTSSDQQELFVEFKLLFNKEYDTQTEELIKYTNFKSFLKLIDARNDAEARSAGTATHGLTQFADLSDDEFKTIYLTFKETEVDMGKFKGTKVSSSSSNSKQASKSNKKKESSRENIDKEDQKETNKKLSTFSSRRKEKGAARTLSTAEETDDESYSNWIGVYTTNVHDQVGTIFIILITPTTIPVNFISYRFFSLLISFFNKFALLSRHIMPIRLACAVFPPPPPTIRVI